MSADSERTCGTPVLTLNYSPVQVVEVKGEVECEFARKPTTKKSAGKQRISASELDPFAELLA
jgi:hypothetical protein